MTDPMLQWIANTQEMQAILGTEVSSPEKLELEWNLMSRKAKRFNEDNAETNLVIARLAQKAGQK